MLSLPEGEKPRCAVQRVVAGAPAAFAAPIRGFQRLLHVLHRQGGASAFGLVPLVDTNCMVLAFTGEEPLPPYFKNSVKMRP